MCCLMKVGDNLMVMKVEHLEVAVCMMPLAILSPPMLGLMIAMTIFAFNQA